MEKSGYPRFRRFANGSLRWDYSPEALRILKDKNKPPAVCQAPDMVQKKAVEEVNKAKGDKDNNLLVLGYHALQFGAFRGQHFRWMLENGLGYVGWIIDNMRGEIETETPLSTNKFLFKKYVNSFEEGRAAVSAKKAERESKSTPQTVSTPVPTSPLASLLKGQRISPEGIRLKARHMLSPKKTWAPYPVKQRPAVPTGEEMRDEELLSCVERLESENSVRQVKPPQPPANSAVTVESHKVTPVTHTLPPVTVETCTKTPVTPTSCVTVETKIETPVTPTTLPPVTVETKTETPVTPTTLPSVTVETRTTATPVTLSVTPQVTVETCTETPVNTTTTTAVTTLPSHGKELLLPDGWKQTLPLADHHWVSRAMFRTGTSGKAEFDANRINRLWWHPPPPPMVAFQPPAVDRYFASKMFVWMPRKMWRVYLHCPQPDCDKRPLVSCGIYPRIRRVLDTDGYYSMAAEYLQCSHCKKKQVAWNSVILEQLDVGHRVQFPAILTYKNACDIRVVRMLRQRGLGNSATQLQKKLAEQHSEAWLQRVAHYLTDCQGFARADTSGLILRSIAQDPPQPLPVPKYGWFLSVYCRDVMQRLDEVKAAVTSTFGRVVKMDSTKKVVKKLAGRVAGTAAWATNVGNEDGQVLMSVLTASEGLGLGPMVSGLVRRYEYAGVPPPELLYVDRDCCGQSQLRRLFSAWPDINIRLDVWHFMRRFAIGCTTDSHPLYGTFMSRLSLCIFEWSGEDLQSLKTAKRAELVKQGVEDPSPGLVQSRITRKELALHCRRQTRGAEETKKLIASMLEAFSGDQGLDTMGVPLLDTDRIWELWQSQQRHVVCIQDPPGVKLYQQTGTLLKGGIQLPVYRCARGSTSLESFHLHLNRFIPGSSASDLHFQAYLLEGLVRWNEDRATAAEGNTGTPSRSYSSLLRHAVNQLSETVMGRKIDSSYATPRKYTGELIGVEYLYSQTGQVLQDMKEEEDDKDSTREEEVADVDEEDEGFEELDEDPTIGSLEDVADPLVPRPAVRPPTRRLDQPAPQRPLLTLPPDPEYEAIAEECSSIRPVEVARRRLTFTSPGDSTSTALGHAPSMEQGPPSPLSTEQGPLPASLDQGTPSSDLSSEDMDPEESVGPDSMEGYGKVEALADYLVSLRDQSRALTNTQATRVITLWKQLHPYDQRPTKFSPRHRSKQTLGRFKASKATSSVPGVDSTKRCFLGQNTGPAQWPDCNRYVEAIVVALCERFPSPVKEDGVSKTRWTLVGRAYKHIREMVLNNSRIMSETRLQLVEINNTTLTQWYNRRAKKQDLGILQQGITLPTPPAVAPQPVPPPRTQRLQRLPTPATGQHVFLLPPNTAGQSSLKRPIVPVRPALQKTSQPEELSTSDVDPPQTDQPVGPRHVLPKSTRSYWKRKYADLMEGKVKRKYSRRCRVTCKKCGNERDPATHKQYFGNWFCEATSFLSYEEWKAGQAAKGYTTHKKKKE